MEKLNAGNANWEEIISLQSKLNGTNLASLIAKESITNGISILEYMNSVFNTTVGPETKMTVDGGTMNMRDAIAYNFKKTII